MKVAILLAVAGVIVVAAYMHQRKRQSTWHQLRKQRTLYGRPTHDERDWQGKFDPTLH
jgi:hypothetical protein